MSINPPLSPTSQPLRYEGEIFLLKRLDTSYSIKTQFLGDFSSKCVLFLTSKRLILVSKDKNTTVKAFDFPLKNVYDEEYKQPVFFCNYLSFKIRPIFASQIGNVEVKVNFEEGKEYSLISAFLSLLDNFRSAKNSEGLLNNFTGNNIRLLFPSEEKDRKNIFFEVQPEPIKSPKPRKVEKEKEIKYNLSGVRVKNNMELRWEEEGKDDILNVKNGSISELLRVKKYGVFDNSGFNNIGDSNNILNYFDEGIKEECLSKKENVRKMKYNHIF